MTLERVASFLRGITSGPLPIPDVVEIQPEHCEPKGMIGIPIRKDLDYFTIKINELFLATGHQLWITYDPMVLVISEFVYGRERISLPYVVGPALIKKEGRDVPHGILLNDTVVAGPYPFRGGRVVLTVILYRAERDNFAGALLKLIEDVSKAVGVPSGAMAGLPVDITALTKIAGSILEGVESLFKLGGTVPIAGHRIELDANSLRGFRSSYSALRSKSNGDVGDLRVVNDRLRRLVDGTPEELMNEDYVLYSAVRSERRNDDRTLPFYQLREQAMSAAVAANDDSWTRAKGSLLSLYEQMVLSPDLTAQEADELFQQYSTELKATRKRAEDIMAMPIGHSTKEAPLDSRLNKAVRALDAIR